MIKWSILQSEKPISAKSIPDSFYFEKSAFLISSSETLKRFILSLFLFKSGSSNEFWITTFSSKPRHIFSSLKNVESTLCFTKQKLSEIFYKNSILPKHFEYWQFWSNTFEISICKSTIKYTLTEWTLKHLIQLMSPFSLKNKITGFSIWKLLKELLNNIFLPLNLNRKFGGLLYQLILKKFYRRKSHFLIFCEIPIHLLKLGTLCIDFIPLWLS